MWKSLLHTSVFGYVALWVKSSDAPAVDRLRDKQNNSPNDRSVGRLTKTQKHRQTYQIMFTLIEGTPIILSFFCMEHSQIHVFFTRPCQSSQTEKNKQWRDVLKVLRRFLELPMASHELRHTSIFLLTKFFCLFLPLVSSLWLPSSGSSRTDSAPSIMSSALSSPVGWKCTLDATGKNMKRLCSCCRVAR